MFRVLPAVYTQFESCWGGAEPACGHLNPHAVILK